MHRTERIKTEIWSGDHGRQGFVCGYSRKQRDIIKSRCEVELVGVSDGINPGLGCRNFFVQQGYVMNRVLLLQDNQSTIKMIQSGRSNSKKSRILII